MERQIFHSLFDYMPQDCTLPASAADAPSQPPEEETEGCRIVHTPQCVGCKHNLGCMSCQVFVRKPDDLIMNRRPCPAFQPT